MQREKFLKNVELELKKDLSLLNIYSDPKEGRILQYKDNRIYLIDFVFFSAGDFW